MTWIVAGPLVYYVCNANVQGYGLTESTACCTTAPTEVDDMAAHFGASGLLLPNVQAMVVDPATNKPLPPNKQGEFWIRGPMIMKGEF